MEVDALRRDRGKSKGKDKVKVTARKGGLSEHWRVQDGQDEMLLLRETHPRFDVLGLAWRCTVLPGPRWRALEQPAFGSS